MFFDFQGQKVLLKAEFEGTPCILVQAGSIFWIHTLAASSLSTCGPNTDSEWQSYDRFSEHESILWQFLKVLHFPLTLFAWPPWNFLVSIVEILFPHIYWPMQEKPFCSWLSHAWVTAWHPAKTRRIRHIAVGFFQFTTKWGCPDHRASAERYVCPYQGG